MSCPRKVQQLPGVGVGGFRANRPSKKLAGMMATTTNTMLFGQADTLSHTMKEGFRRTDLLVGRIRRLTRRTGEQTMRAALDKRQAEQQQASQKGKSRWHRDWLRNEPALDEILLATHAGRKSIDAKTVQLHAEERHSGAVESARQRQLRQGPARTPGSEQRAGTESAGEFSAAGAAAAAVNATAAAAALSETPSEAAIEAQAVRSGGGVDEDPAWTRVHSAREQRTGPASSMQSARRPAPSRPQSARASAQLTGQTGAAGRAKAKSSSAHFFGAPASSEPSSAMAASILRREDLHSLLYDVHARAMEAEREQAVAESRARSEALTRQAAFASSATAAAGAAAVGGMTTAAPAQRLQTWWRGEAKLGSARGQAPPNHRARTAVCIAERVLVRERSGRGMVAAHVAASATVPAETLYRARPPPLALLLRRRHRAAPCVSMAACVGRRLPLARRVESRLRLQAAAQSAGTDRFSDTQPRCGAGVRAGQFCRLGRPIGAAAAHRAADGGAAENHRQRGAYRRRCSRPAAAAAPRHAAGGEARKGGRHRIRLGAASCCFGCCGAKRGRRVTFAPDMYMDDD